VAGCTRASQIRTARLEPDAFRRLFEATVSIGVDLPDGRTRVGSGFVASADGWVVTSSHVIAPVTGSVTVDYATGEASAVGGIYTWAGRDLAVLIPRAPADVEPLRLADSRRLRAGDIVFACGVPFGLGRTVTRGIVDRRSIFQSARYIVLDGIVAAGFSYPGDSGGPVVNTDGQVVGVHLGSLDPERRAVVPSNLVRRTLVEARVQAEVRRREIELGRLTS
jgi:S1-C subfamily serine protease